jgi:hypothetical protein
MKSIFTQHHNAYFYAFALAISVLPVVETHIKHPELSILVNILAVYLFFVHTKKRKEYLERLKHQG